MAVHGRGEVFSIKELVESRKWVAGPDPTLTLVFRAIGTSFDKKVIDEALAVTAPNMVQNGFLLYRGNVEVDPIWVDQSNDEGHWKVTVHYGKPQLVDLSFDSTGGTYHIKTAIEHGKDYPDPATNPLTPNHEGVIGWDGSKAVGVDIHIPIYHFSETYLFPANLVTAIFRADIFDLTGTVNASNFRGFAPGEVLFLGASGTSDQNYKFKVDYKFAASPTLKNIWIGKTAKGVEVKVPKKLGWEYIWVEFEPVVVNHSQSGKVKAAHLEAVYLTGDFRRLHIGEGPEPNFLLEQPIG